MEANAGLVAGSHNRNELVVIRPENEGVSHWPSLPPPPFLLSLSLSSNTPWQQYVWCHPPTGATKVVITHNWIVVALTETGQSSCCVETWHDITWNDILCLFVGGAAAKTSEACQWPHLSNLWGWCRLDHRGRALCSLQWMCIPCLPPLLWLRAQRWKPIMPSVQDQIQTS
jgi:hypothetical protein